MNPRRRRIRVDLPAPLGPSNPKTSPRATWSVHRSRAVKSPNRFVKSRVSITAALSGKRAGEK